MPEPRTIGFKLLVVWGVLTAWASYEFGWPALAVSLFPLAWLVGPFFEGRGVKG